MRHPLCYTRHLQRMLQKCGGCVVVSTFGQTTAEHCVPAQNWGWRVGESHAHILKMGVMMRDSNGPRDVRQGQGNYLFPSYPTLTTYQCGIPVIPFFSPPPASPLAGGHTSCKAPSYPSFGKTEDTGISSERWCNHMSNRQFQHRLYVRSVPPVHQVQQSAAERSQSVPEPKHQAPARCQAGQSSTAGPEQLPTVSCMQLNVHQGGLRLEC